MNKKILYIIIAVITCLGSSIHAQVVAEGDTILCSGQEGNVEVTLTATSYAVDLINTGISTDDTFGGVINLNFDFVFYGNTYNQVTLSSNNFLSFNLANANTASQWQINDAIPNNVDGAETTNGILCPWQDIQPGVNGNGVIAYATIGEAPNRVFIASFCGIPMFSCTDICYSSQIKLFETTNIIETHIAQKVLCTSWNGGAAIHGLHNIDGTIAHVVTGLDGIERNYPNQWTCENDGWRFSPNGATDYILESIEFAPAVAGTDIIWQDQFGNQIGTGGTITVIPGGNVVYTAGASLCGAAGDWCGFEGGIEGDDVSITFEELEINGDATDIVCYSANNGVIEVIAPTTGNWVYSLYEDGTLINLEQENQSDGFVFQNLSPGTYTATITEEESGCVSEELILEIIEPNEINADTNITSIECYGEDNGSIEIEINGGTPPYSTLIGDDTQTIDIQTGNTVLLNNLNAGDYYFSTTDNNGCLIPGDEVFFSISEPSEIIINTDEIGQVTCEDAANGFISITTEGGNNESYTYLWSSNNGFVSSEEDISEISGGLYTLEVIDANDCSASITIEINENEGITLEGSISECIIDNNGVITTNISGGTPEYTYSLVYNNEIFDTNNTGVFSNLNGGEYSIIVSDFFECESEIPFSLNSAPIADFSVNEYEFYLSNNPSEFTDLTDDTDIMSWSWDFGDGNSSNEQNPSHLYTNPGIYYINLIVTDSYGCTDEITQKVEILQDYYSYTPTIFTPNNDGINDTFSPSLVNIDKSAYLLLIFDRWGNQVFETTKYSEGWEGREKNGTLLPPDVYSYKITYNTNRGVSKIEKGHLIMAR